MFKAVRKNAFRENSKAKRGNYFNRENIVLIILQCNIKSGIMTVLNIYHLSVTFCFCYLVLIRSRRRGRKKIKEEEKGVCRFDLNLLIEQVAVLIKA